MDQIRRLLASLSIKQRITIGAAAIAVIAVIVMASRWTHERDFKPLYRNLSAEDAGVVVAKVHENGSEYRLADSGSTVLVPPAKGDEAAPADGGGGTSQERPNRFRVVRQDAISEQPNSPSRSTFSARSKASWSVGHVALGSGTGPRTSHACPRIRFSLKREQAAKASVMVKLRRRETLGAERARPLPT